MFDRGGNWEDDDEEETNMILDHIALIVSKEENLSFYEKMGFEARPCEWDGPGMFKMIR